MILSWSETSWGEYLDWQTKDKKILKRINALLDDIKRNGYDGIGSPEPLKHELSGFWSRRIDDKNRLVYSINEDSILVIQCGTHYRKK